MARVVTLIVSLEVVDGQDRDASVRDAVARLREILAVATEGYEIERFKGVVSALFAVGHVGP